MIKKTQQNAQKKYIKALRNIFYELAQLSCDVMIYLPNFRQTEEICWCHFVRGTHSQAVFIKYNQMQALELNN